MPRRAIVESDEEIVWVRLGFLFALFVIFPLLFVCFVVLLVEGGEPFAEFVDELQ